MRRLAAVCLALALLAGPALGQSSPDQPDERGEAFTREPVYRGVRAWAATPAELHVRNEGGSDGAGLCVIASTLVAGMSQRIRDMLVPGAGTSNQPGNTGQVGDAPGKGSRYWRTARSRPGGYYPQKLEALAKEVLPDIQYGSWLSTDGARLEALTKQGYPVGVTMNTGRLYHYQRISHMGTLVHFDASGTGLACIVDNNNPGVWSWMPCSEFLSRWIDNGVGWAWVWKVEPARDDDAPPTADDVLLGGALAILALLGLGTGGAAAVVLLTTPRPTPIPATPPAAAHETPPTLRLVA